MRTKFFAILVASASLSSCETASKVPITLSYQGHAGGHEYTAGYNSSTGAVLVVNQK